MNYYGIKFKWELNEKQKEIIKWLVDNDFNISSVNQYITKIKMLIEKDGVSIPCEIPSQIYNVKGFIDTINENYILARKLSGDE